MGSVNGVVVRSCPNAVWQLWLPGYDLRKDNPNAMLRRHWTARSKRSRMAREVVFLRGRAVGALPIDNKLVGPLQIHVVRSISRKGKAFDSDNAVAACKFLIDALVSNGVLVGDGIQVLPLAPVVEQVRGFAPGVLLCVHRLGDEGGRAA